MDSIRFISIDNCMKRFIVIMVSAILCFSAGAANLHIENLMSPDGRNVVNVQFDDNAVYYEVFRDGVRISGLCALSMTVDDETWGAGSMPRKITRDCISEEIRFIVPRKYDRITVMYNVLILHYKGYNIEFRAYNDGIAYRFSGTSDRIGEVVSERIEYVFDKSCMSYTLLTDELQNWYEEDYTVSALESLPKDRMSIIPVSVESGNFRVLLSEANLYDYPGLYLVPSGTGFAGKLSEYPAKEEFFYGTNKLYVTEREQFLVRCNLKRNFPWRVMGIFDDDSSILNSELIYILSDKTDEDYSWVKPGQVLWDWWNHNNIYGVDFRAGINTETYLYMIDFASQNDIPYILIDDGWSDKDDLLSVNPQVDMSRICGYAQDKGVKVILWAKWINVDKQMDVAFEQFRKWGVAGIKIDFMDRNDAKMVNFYERVARKATEYHFLIDFHGSYPNEGMRAKYPNLMTREGVIGLEYNKWSDRATPRHDLIIPFLRMWAGPMDYTPGAMLNSQPEWFRINNLEPMSQGTRVHQMAMYVVYESPLQMLSDSPTKYLENMDCLKFMTAVPTVWDDTVPLFGEVGENIGIARRSGDDWFIGIMGNENAQTFRVCMKFLGDGNYNMVSYSDGLNADINGKDYVKTEKTVDMNTILDVRLAPGGGFVARISRN